jgi:molybdenum cofactor cytidylyltransferase/nicotine blue oxidoreductase
MTIARDSHQNSGLRLAILLLAAGEGSRLGGYPKALLKKDGESLLKRFCLSAETFDPVQILVLTGFYSDVIEEEVQSLKQAGLRQLECIRNESPELGQSSSVRLGLESMKSEYDVLLIALCDQPNVGAPEMEFLLKQFTSRSLGQEIILPLVHGQRGNPVLFSKRVIDDILKIPGMVPRAYMDQNPRLVKIFQTSNQAYIVDVDTRVDIQKLGLDAV